MKTLIGIFAIIISILTFQNQVLGFNNNFSNHHAWTEDEDEDDQVAADSALSAIQVSKISTKKDNVVNNSSDSISFAAVADTHYNATLLYANREQVEAINFILSEDVNKRLLKLGYSPKIKGLIVAGDLTDNGEVEQFNSFKNDYGLKGDKLIKLPVFETSGNHDYSTGKKYNSPNEVPVIKNIIDRNRNRQDVVAVGPGGQYAWKWGDVVFINLGLKPSDDETTTTKKNGLIVRFTPPFDSLSFLKKTLNDKSIVNQKSKIVITAHYSFKGPDKRFSAVERRAFYDVIKSYNVIALLHGHTHRTSTSSWCGIPLFTLGGIRMVNSNKKADVAYAVFDISEEYLQGMTVAWPFMRLQGPEQLNLGQKCEVAKGTENDSYCWNKKIKLNSIRVESDCKDI